jgi:hypothetical protein
MKTGSPMAESLAPFQRKQYAFAAHIRDPQRHPRPEDVEDRRMAVYRELFYNNVEGFLASGFPVLRRLYTDTDWHRMARDLFAHHRSRTPYFLEITQEFLQYLREEREPRPEDPPFVMELAHYEWVELALAISEDEPAREEADPHRDLLEGRPALSHTAWLLRYQYPVHRIGPEFRPAAPGDQPTFLMAFRDAHDQISFMELSPVTARLLALIEERPLATGREILGHIVDELRHLNPDAVLEGGRQTLTQLRSAGVLLGTYRYRV